MLGRLSGRRIAVYGVSLVGGALAWLLLAPPQLGGSASYVVVDGGSMEPVLSDGDLAVVREADRYEAGDAVAYRSDDLGRVVLHRIVRAEGDRLVLRGDANGWTDSSRPLPSDVLGVLWFSVPGAGSAVSWLGEPRNAAAVTGLLVLAFLAAAGVTVRRRRPARHRRRGAARPARPSPIPADAERGEIGLEALVVPALGAAAVLLLASLVLGLFSFSRPSTSNATRDVSYRHEGSFDYTSRVRPGPAYPDGRVDAGEPAFLRVVDRLDASFDYRLDSSAEHDVAGTAALSVELSNDSGWRRTVSLEPRTTFTGDEVRLAGTLDLRALREIVNRVENATGVSHAAYSVALVPDIRVEGRLDDARFEDLFAPRLRFTLDGLQLRLENVAADGSPSPSLGVRRQRSVPVSEVSPRELSLGPLGLEVASARRLAVGAGGVGLAALLLLGALALTGRWASEPARIRLAYGRLLVPLAAPPAGGPVVEVGSMRALARLASTSDRPILVHETPEAVSYHVDDGVALYRYRAPVALPEPEPRPGSPLNGHESGVALPSAPPPPPVTGGAVERS